MLTGKLFLTILQRLILWWLMFCLCDAWFVIREEVNAGQKTAKLSLHGNPREAGRWGSIGRLWADEDAVAGE